jgi:glutamate carboxypeptidase
MLDRHEAHILDGIADDRPAMLARVHDWAAVNSGSRNLAGLAEMARRLGGALEALGGRVERVAAAPATVIDPDGQPRSIRHGDHLSLVRRPEAPVQILLTGHMDTVFAEDDPFQSVVEAAGGVLRGPGVADMKGGIVVMLAALAAFETSRWADGLGYRIVLNSDEEVSSPSSAALLARSAAGARLAFTYEPALPDGTLAGGRRGSGNFSAVVTGRAAHAGRDPEQGRNAVIAAADLALRLRALGHTGLSVNASRIDGGGPPNVVPARAVLRFNLRATTPADRAAAEPALAEIIAAVAREHDTPIHLHGGFARPPKPLDAVQAPLFEFVRACGADLGLPIAWRDTGGVCDGNNIAATGIPVVDTMGVRGGGIHSDEEYMVIDSLVERARLSALALMRLARGDGPLAATKTLVKAA